MFGEDVREELELGNLECPRADEAGLIGDVESENVEERETCWLWLVDTGESTSPCSLFRASTSCGSMKAFNSRPRIFPTVMGENECFGFL